MLQTILTYLLRSDNIKIALWSFISGV